MSDTQLTTLILTALLSENVVLVTCLGIGTRPQAFLDTTDGRRTGLSLTLVMVLCGLLSRWLDFFLIRFQLTYLRLVLFSLLAPAVVWLLRRATAAYLPELSHRVDEHLASLTVNAAALGAMLIASQRGYEVGQTVLYCLFGGLGATLVMISLAGLREEVSFESCPKSFRGPPILLITAGLMALALVGFYGINIL